MVLENNGRKQRGVAGGAPKKPANTSTRAVPKTRKPAKRTVAKGHVLETLPAAITGRASPAKAALSDKPVVDYIASLPQPQRSIAEGVDTLAAKTLKGPVC